MSITQVVVISVGAGLATIVVALTAYPLKRWVAKCRRRKGGIYLWRVDHHRNRARRHTGYAGLTNSFYLRSRQHMGMSRFHPVTGAVVKGRGPGVAMTSVPKQPWSDLRPRMYKVIKLPWWLCWHWIMHPLETIVIWVTCPVYNIAKQPPWNLRRVPKGLAVRQRANRDAGGYAYRTRASLAHLGRRALMGAGVVLILVVAYGWVVTR